MFDLNIYFYGFVILALAAVFVWGVSLYRHNVDIVDSLWSLLFLFAALTYVYNTALISSRANLLLGLVSIWALRLCIYLTARNWGHEEDRRYQAIRRRHEPGFAFSSVYRIFLFQAVLAWFISLPLLGAILSAAPFGILDYLGISLWVIGFIFEAVGDWQLSVFKRNPANAGQVMDQGLWRYTRHPNYFGDFCVWWGFYLMALSAGAWWSIIGPMLMSMLLLKVSGVTLLERDIGKRRPAYAEYIQRTNAFFPGVPRS